MLKANHISENFYLKDMNDSILASVNNFLIASFNGNDKYEGCYMFYNKQEEILLEKKMYILFLQVILEMVACYFGTKM